MDVNPPSVPHTPPSPPKSKSRLGTYVAMLLTTFTKTMGVGLGLVFLILAGSLVTEESQKRQCNVAVHTLHGELATYVYDTSVTDGGALVRALASDESDTGIKAIIIDVDSPGGSPVAGEEIANQLAWLTKPNVAVIRGLGASAAYWAATGADKIFASRSSDIGGIGVSVSFPDESEKNKKEGISYNEFGSGKYKYLGTPTRPVTKDEKIILERDIEMVFTHFVEMVARGRNMDVAVVRALADGSTMTGARALESGLIDALGGMEDARLYIEGEIGEEAVLCEPDSVSLF